MNKNLKTLLVKLGLILSAILITINIVVYFISIDIILNPIYGISLFFFNIIFGIGAFIYSKREFSNESNSFKSVFSAYIIPIIIGLLVTSVFTFIYFNFLNEEHAKYIQNKTLELFANTIKSFPNGNTLGQETLNKLKTENQFSLSNLLKTVFSQIIFYSVIGVLVGVAFKRKTIKKD